jgi:hypothetical protein
VCTPSPADRTTHRRDIISPVSRNRQVNAADLAYREDLQTGTLNLNIAETGGSTGTQPVPWRRVRPGPYARSPFVLGYEPPVRASSKGIKFYTVFSNETAGSMT